MTYYLTVDDTDAPGTPGSGHILEAIGRDLEREGLAVPSRITRHQLFVHPDVPYTSHNSAMCMPLTGIEHPGEAYGFAAAALIRLAAEGSDPGICLAGEDEIGDADLLIDFGRRAKGELLTKGEARRIADRCGLRLDELGGTGDGIIGAVAGLGLYLTGNDGRFRGKFPLPFPGPFCTVRELTGLTEIDAVAEIEGRSPLMGEARVRLLPLVKTVYLWGKSVLPVRRGDGGWRCLDKDEIKKAFP